VSTGTLAPYTFPQAFDSNGNPLSAGLLYTYLSGTSTPAMTWTDAALSVPNTNPIVLDAAGRYLIYLAAQNYKFVLKDFSGVTIDTTDPVGSVGLQQSGVFDIFTFFGDPTSPITSTTYPSGSTFDTCHAGTAIYQVDSATLPAGTYKLSGMLLGTGGITVTVGIVNLTDGAPDTPLTTMSSNSTTGAAVQSGAITFATGGVSKSYGIKAQVSGGQGFAWGIQLVKIS
jgi:hypothetical protein